jgi:RNA polymerase sigma-70 factor (ECF subfamily)
MYKLIPDMDESEKLQQAMQVLRQGSAEAFHLLYEKYNRKVFRFCLRMLGDTDTAKDAFQETFISIYEHRREFRGQNFQAWAFTIARHTCLNALRSRKEHESFDEISYYSMKGEPVAEGTESDVGLKDCISKAVGILPLALREAFLLREYEECSYQEISDILGIDLSLAKVRVFRAREILRKLLTPLKQELYES